MYICIYTWESHGIYIYMILVDFRGFAKIFQFRQTQVAQSTWCFENVAF